jgi:Nif-specific regulatory protein
LEKEELVIGALDDGAVYLELPIWQERLLIGVICLRLPVKTSKSEIDRAVELGQWASYLIEEATTLRKFMDSQKIREETAYAPAQERQVRDQGTQALSFHGMIGSSAAMREVYSLIGKVAATSATVLLTGESGTGKELAARAVHECSSRSSGPFIAVNCAALPESIVESELFGHEKGSFTGAISSRIGRFEAAKDGTLFLDEIGDLPLSVQTKLLRILQEKTFERVGGQKTLKTNARIIAATNRDLHVAVQEGKFREDLYFRLNVFPLHIPPLRDRGADILLLADHFADKFSRDSETRIKRISSPALDLLMIYHWPGNVRELENCISRAAILASDGVIHSYNLPPSLQSASSTGTEPTSTFDGAVARLEKELLVEALKIERGNSASAARRLGMTERRFRFALQKYKIDFHGFRTKM